MTPNITSDWQFEETQEMLVDVCISLGLAMPPPIRDVPFQSDHHIVLQRLQSMIVKTLSRGWWFNRRRNALLEPQGATGSIIGRFLRVSPLRYQNSGCEPPRTRLLRVVPGLTELVPVDVDLDVPGAVRWETPILADVIEFPEARELPFEFTEYVVAKTANTLASLFGVPKDNDREIDAWNALLRSDADGEETLNVVEGNPHHWTTTRTR